MSYKYDPEKYRALGVGEVVKEGHWWGDGSTGYLTPLSKSSYGYIVTGNEDGEFLEAIPAIAKDVYPTGGARSSSAGRGRFDLLPWPGMLALARRYEYGAERFGAQNWRKGVPLSRILSSLRRHSSQVGYDFTEDHAAAVAWNAFAWITMVEDMRAGLLPKELDDLGVLDKEIAR